MDKPMDSELPTGLSTALLEAGYPQAPQLRRRLARLNATMEFARFNATKSVHSLIAKVSSATVNSLKLQGLVPMA
jgi:hypothetical protein